MKVDNENVFKCGTKVTIIKEHGSFTINYYCGRWEHEPCKKYKIKKLKERIMSFKGIIVYVGVVPDEKRWIEKNIKQKHNYLCIKFDDKKIIISEKKFPGCEKREKNKFIKELPALLEPITEGRRISGRRFHRKVAEQSESESLAAVAGDKVKELSGMSLNDKMAWIINQPDKVFYKKGRLLLTQL
ncbi:MAG: hypothetical protein KKC46_20115 [Proteobacteria bacterium]|nr:hypothetical protein [Pseudomonadota bacterium]